MQSGFTGWLVKPVRAASLAARLGSERPCPRLDRGPADGRNAKMPVAPTRSVLIAEDNEINALLTRALVEKMGHRATVVTDGAAAVEAWAEARAEGTSFDLVLMDLHMPRVDGLQAVAQIRAREAEGGGASTAVVALTANATLEDCEAGLAAGMDGFLTKPIDRARLAAALAGQFSGLTTEFPSSPAASDRPAA
jgi:CheY-like chemotaxis protein